MNREVESFELLKECIVDYVDPIVVIGNIDFFKTREYVTILPATTPKEDLIIFNNRYPKWLLKVLYNCQVTNGILLITDFDKISTAEQKLFVDIICHGLISGENLPKNLKIIINAEKDFDVIPEIREVIELIQM